MKKRCFCAICLCMLLILTGCNDTNKNQSTESSESENTEKESVLNEVEIFSQRDYVAEYDVEDCAHIRLNGDSATSDSNAVEIEDGLITIIDEGTYIVSGILENGMIIVDSEDTDKTQIVLNGVSIHSETSAAIYIKQSDKVFITLEADTENVLSNGGTFEQIDENEMDGVIFSKADCHATSYGSTTTFLVLI